jgi:hypothetical protein
MIKWNNDCKQAHQRVAVEECDATILLIIQMLVPKCFSFFVQLAFF